MTEIAKDQNIALYTKYRPKKFKDVLGQEHVVAPLSICIKENKITHAYVFAGSRGTGKTSVARIFAEEIGTTKDDLYEIDAASNTSVEDIRALNESVSTLPLNSKHKVYILDEVHMLSKSAFNALLKTIEEPPQHVIFILATTEIHKVPDTIISRCETYQFKKPNRSILKKMIVKTAKEEGYEINSAVAELVAILGDGSFRDTHTILQKVIRSSSDKVLSLEEVEKVTGAPSNLLINKILNAYADSELDSILKYINSLKESNVEEKVFVKLFLEKFRAIILIKIARDSLDFLKEEFSEDDLKNLREIATEKATNFNSKNLLNFLENTEKIQNSVIPFLRTEMSFMETLSKD